jgi:hypothetical protein
MAASLQASSDDIIPAPFAATFGRNPPSLSVFSETDEHVAMSMSLPSVWIRASGFNETEGKHEDAANQPAFPNHRYYVPGTSFVIDGLLRRSNTRPGTRSGKKESYIEFDPNFEDSLFIPASDPRLRIGGSFDVIDYAYMHDDSYELSSNGQVNEKGFCSFIAVKVDDERGLGIEIVRVPGFDFYFKENSAALYSTFAGAPDRPVRVAIRMQDSDTVDGERFISSENPLGFYYEAGGRRQYWRVKTLV